MLTNSIQTKKEVIELRQTKIVLQTNEASMNPTSKELAKIVMNRLGLEPRKTGSTDKMYRTLIELYERSKQANRMKKLEHAVMTVEEMGAFAGISRQTMYDYLRRWLELDMIVKSSYIINNRVIIGYRLNGATLEISFEKARHRIMQNLDLTGTYIKELQRLIKNEKIAESQKIRNLSDEIETEEETITLDKQELLITA